MYPILPANKTELVLKLKRCVFDKNQSKNMNILKDQSLEKNIKFWEQMER